MDANFKCGNCSSESSVRGYNVVRMASRCYVCGTNNGVAEFLENFYGEAVGKVARAELSWLNKVADRAKQNSELSQAIQAVDLNIEAAIRLAQAA